MILLYSPSQVQRRVFLFCREGGGWKGGKVVHIYLKELLVHYKYIQKRKKNNKLVRIPVMYVLVDKSIAYCVAYRRQYLYCIVLVKNLYIFISRCKRALLVPLMHLVYPISPPPPPPPPPPSPFPYSHPRHLSTSSVHVMHDHVDGSAAREDKSPPPCPPPPLCSAAMMDSISILRESSVCTAPHARSAAMAFIFPRRLATVRALYPWLDTRST